ncbi:MAG: phosphopyruvate hydratase [Bacteroides sp.]|nr:MAG: phosphopyruvate hydratase [Bacteroides sp.]
MTYIKDIKARQVLDSRGNPTIEVDVITSNNAYGTAIVPSGASKGKYEAFELRDNDKSYYNGKSVLKAINNIEKYISKSLYKVDIFDIDKIDNIMLLMDSSCNKSIIGANSMLGISLAAIKAAAIEKKIPLFQYIDPTSNILPIPMINILNGGQHANNNLSFQEFMIMPCNAKSFSEAIHVAFKVFNNLKNILIENNLSTNVGDEGGFAPNINSNKDAIEFLLKAIKKSNYNPEKDVLIALDIASASFFSNQNYLVDNNLLNSDNYIQYLIDLCNEYPIKSIEDGIYEDNWQDWSFLNMKLGNNVQIVGDDLFTTNIDRLKKGIDNNSANAILIKPNQIGTFTETRKVVDLAKKNQYNCIMSHRSGDSEDNIIADLSVGLKCKYIKTGSLSRSERISKYNQLLRIEKFLGKKSFYAGIDSKYI